MNVVLSLADKEILEMEAIALDNDSAGALEFIKHLLKRMHNDAKRGMITPAQNPENSGL
jgi:hypothetical protein